MIWSENAALFRRLKFIQSHQHYTMALICKLCVWWERTIIKNVTKLPNLDLYKFAGCCHDSSNKLYFSFQC